MFMALPKVLSPVTTVTDFFFPLGALETHICFVTSSFFFGLTIPFPPLFCRFFSSSPPPPPSSSLSTTLTTFSNSLGRFFSNHCLHFSYSG